MYRMVSLTKMAQVELRSGRVVGPAGVACVQDLAVNGAGRDLPLRRYTRRSEGDASVPPSDCGGQRQPHVLHWCAPTHGGQGESLVPPCTSGSVSLSLSYGREASNERHLHKHIQTALTGDAGGAAAATALSPPDKPLPVAGGSCLAWRKIWVGKEPCGSRTCSTLESLRLSSPLTHSRSSARPTKNAGFCSPMLEAAFDMAVEFAVRGGELSEEGEVERDARLSHHARKMLSVAVDRGG